MLKKLVFVKAAVILLLISTPSFASNYANSFGCSPKGIAMGNAMVAHVNDWSSVYYNIAGLGRTGDDQAHKNELAVSYIYNDPDLHVDISRDDANMTWDKGLETGTIVLGGVLDINLLTGALPGLVSSCRFGIVSGMNDDLSLVKINDIDLRTHNFIMYGRESQNIMIMMGMGFGFFNDTFGFGVGANPSMGGKGRIIASDLSLTTDAQAPSMETTFDFEVSDNPLLFGFYLDLGKIFGMLNGVSFGLSHRQESYLYVDDFLQGAIMDTGNIPLELMAAMFDFYSPPSTTFGFSYQTENLTLSFDYETREWSKHKISKYREEEIEDVLDEEVPDLDDISILKLGFSYSSFMGLDIMAGYYQQESCVPDKATTGYFNLLDNDKTVYSFGASYPIGQDGFASQLLKLKGPAELFFAYQYQKLDDRSVTKDEEYIHGNNPDYSYGGSFSSFMFGFSYKL